MTNIVNFYLPTVDNIRLANLCGAMDCNIDHIARAFSVKIKRRGGQFQLNGSAASSAADAIKSLYSRADKDIHTNEIRLHLAQQFSKNVDIDNTAMSEKFRHQSIHKSLVFEAKTASQQQFWEKIQRDVIALCAGPAGSGKTHVAIIAALNLLEDKKYHRLLLSRPVIEAGGERLGYLPGDMEQKINPYLRPLYDILGRVLGKRELEKRIASGDIDFIPLAFMRGLTFNNTVLILDEGQNTTPDQMKMLLSRLGENSKIIITGDKTQSDLSNGVISGLSDAFRRLSDIDGVSFHTFNKNDIVRHPLVHRILRAYERD